MAGSDTCQDCGVKATTFKDPNDGGLYCWECWIQFYGRPPAGAPTRSAADVPVQSEVKDLPEDAPRGHPAHHAVKYQGAKKVFSFQWHGAGGSRIPFQTTVPAAGNSRWAAEVIARACYMKFEQGWTKDKILEWRNQCYARLGGRAPSLMTSQAASQRGPRRTEAPARSRSSYREPKASQAAAASGRLPKVERTEEAKAKSGETFLPPNHLKLLLDNPQAALPKSQVKIRSQGVAFSQASQVIFRHSQEDFEKREDIFKSTQEPQRFERPPDTKQARNGFLYAPQEDSKGPCAGNHRCCCCRARYDGASPSNARHCSEGKGRASDAERPFTPQKPVSFRSAYDVERVWEQGPQNKDAELQETKRKRCEERSGDSIFESQFKKLKEEPPESQHSPETQPTPFIYEPPVMAQPIVSESLPTPMIETPTPLPESLVAVPVLSIVHETVTTPWCTQPTPKVDPADWLFISDPTPMPPAKDDQDAVLPELTQPTPVPPAPGTKPQSESKEDSFADTAIDREEEVGRQETNEVKAEAPPAAPDSAFPTVSLDVVTQVRTKPVPPVPVMPPVIENRKPPAKKGSELNFAAMLLQRMQAASANRQDPQASRKGEKVCSTPKLSNLNKLKVFVSDAEQNPESEHPPPEVHPEDGPPVVRATI